MELALSVLVSLFVLSLAANIVLLTINKQLRKSPPPQQTYDATALMHDITAGQAMVRVVRVDPTDVFIRSPRDKA